jgi:O-antigen ligase
MHHLPKLLLLFIGLAPLITPINYQGAMTPDLFRGVYLQLGVLLITILWLLSLIKTPTLVIHKIMLPLIVFLIWASLSLLWTKNSYLTMTNLIIWLDGFLLFFITLQLFKTSKDIIQLLNLIVLSGVVVSIIGISQHLFDFDWITQATKPAATFGNKNMAVHFLVLIIPINIGLLLNNKNKIQQILLAFALTITSLYLIYANSRAGYLSAIAEVILFSIFIFKHKKSSSTTHKVLILIAIVLPFIFNFTLNKGVNIQTRMANIVKIKANTNVTNERIPMWLNTLAMLKENPILGVGLGNWRIQYPLYLEAITKDTGASENKMHRHAHNDWLEIMSSLGLVGLLLLIWIAFTLIQFIKKLLKQQKQPFVVFGLSMSFIGLFIDGFFSFPLKLIITPLLIMVIFASLVVLNQDKKEIKLNIGLIFLLLIIFITLLSLSIKHSSDNLKAQVYHNNTLIYQINKKYDKMLGSALKAYKLNPNKMVHQLSLAKGYFANQQMSKAQEIINTSLKNDPYNYPLLALLAKSYLKIKNFPEAQKVLERLAKFMSKHKLVTQYLKNIYLHDISQFIKNKQYLKAKETYLKLLKIETTGINYQNIAIIMFNNLNQKKESVMFFKKALELNPNLPQAQTIKNIINHF